MGDIQFSGLICKRLFDNGNFYEVRNKHHYYLYTKFGWSVNDRSMQVEEVGSGSVGWDINWCKPWVVNESILEPSCVVISF